MWSIRQPKVALRPTAVRPMLLANRNLLPEPYDRITPGSTLQNSRLNMESPLGRHFTCDQNLRRKVVLYALCQQIFIITLPSVQTAKRPQMTEMKAGEGTSVAEFAIG
jgi:hypothetical protein